MATTTKALTVRLPAELYQQGGEIAKRRGLSLNALLQEGLRTVLKQDEDQRLYEAFGELGEDAKEADVEFAAEAQWEVVSRGEA